MKTHAVADAAVWYYARDRDAAERVGKRAARQCRGGRRTTEKIVLVAGTKSHGPGHHEYEQGARLLRQCLDSSPNAPPLAV